uniref:Uncharacterized protein n=1 Tax=Anguilla anguilla TaxID=7936 RepID=A0A0E9XPS2_ANGAN
MCHLSKYAIFKNKYKDFHRLRSVSPHKYCTYK